MTWFAFQTVPQAELRACASLAALADDTFLPMEKQSKRIRHRKVLAASYVPMFRGYVFARFPGEPPWYALEALEDERGRKVLRAAPHHVVRWRKDGAPAGISDPAMYELRIWTARFSEGNAPEEMQALNVGDLVTVTDGPFRSMRNARIERLDRRKLRMTVLIDLFGRATSVELDNRQVEAA